MTITPLIATYNAAARLGCTLSWIPLDIRSVVMEDGSHSDHVRDACLECNAVHVRHGENRGPIACYADLAARTVADVLLFLSDDVQLPLTFFSTLQQLIALPGIGVLSWRSRGEPPGGSRVDTPGLLVQATELAGYCMAVRRDVYEKIGGFDTSFRQFFADSDLCVRTTLAGHPCYRVYWPLVGRENHTTNVGPRGSSVEQDRARFIEKWGGDGPAVEKRVLEEICRR